MIEYAYDDLNRLVDEHRKEGQTTVYRRECEYDKVGNRTNLTKTDGQTSVEYGYTYNGLGQLATQYSPESSPTSRYVYSYDLNGNLTQKDEEVGGDPWVREYRWTYEWDVQDRLIKVEKYDEVAMEYGRQRGVQILL